MADNTDDTKWGSLYSKPSGNPYAYAQEEDDKISLHKEPTDSQKRAYFKKLQNPHAHTAIFGDQDSAELTEEWVLKILASYLPKSSQARDRKAVKQMASEFVAHANVLSLEQKRLIKRRLLSMKPEGEVKLEAARTTQDTIKESLQKLLDDVKKTDGF